MEEKVKLYVRVNQKVNMVEFLIKLGYKEKRVGNNYFFHSPLRDENTPSFSVHATDNVWKDWGTGASGTFIEFGALKYGSVSQFVKELLKYYPNLYDNDDIKQAAIVNDSKAKDTQADAKEEPDIKIIRVRSLFSYPLLKYLQERRIPQAIADKFCKEITYELKGKEYYAIGFKNDANGYALRNRYIKQATVPNDSTFIDNGYKDLAVFEGFFDFLSYQVLYHNQEALKRNFLILNSTSFFEKCLPKLQEHRKADLFLDNDKSGTDCTALAQGLLGDRIVDQRSIYANYKDLNKFHECFGQTQKPRLNQRL